MRRAKEEEICTVSTANASTQIKDEIQRLMMLLQEEELLTRTASADALCCGLQWTDKLGTSTAQN
jgi:hypothetical protein